MHNLKKLVDVLNLNAQASCLSSKRWFKALEGGNNSELYQILEAYVVNDCKVTLGIVGSTLIEIKTYNPECIQLINNHPKVFEVLFRPYIHSLSILWSDNTFKNNFNLGKTLISSTFKNIVNWYLPPEFALRNSQVYMLTKCDVEGTFIHPKRVKDDLKSALPEGVFSLHSVQESTINCLSFTEHFDAYYLEELQLFESSISFQNDIVYGWRDAESPFFLPDSVKREISFIQNSSKKFERIFLSEIANAPSKIPKPEYKAYPQNSLLPWLGDFRLYWYMSEIKSIEKEYETLPPIKQLLFFNLLNSDILSSIEKNDVTVKLKQNSEASHTSELIIKRKERNLDAEEILYLIQNKEVHEIETYIQNANRTFFKKIRARLQMLPLIKGN